MPIDYAFFSSPIGELLLSFNEHGLLSLNINQTVSSCPISKEERPTSYVHSQLIMTIQQRLAEYFADQSTRFDDLPKAPQGTIFQRDVWRYLETIPYGQSVSYSDVAKAINRPKAIRAVGQAISANPLLIITPCHRVLGKQYSLTGFSSGLAVKRYLLTLEQISYCE